jgi:hypothetical protein
MLPTDALRTPGAAAGSVAEAVNCLQDRRGELAARVAYAERRLTFASSDAVDARDALTRLERRRLGGEDVSDAETRKAEKRLTDAQATSREPWAERAQAARSAVRDTEREIAALINEHLSELLENLHAEGQAVAEQVNAALTSLIAAYEARERVAQRIDSVAGVIRPPRFGDIALTRLEPVVREARRVLDGEGERPPRLTHDPREPRGGVMAPTAQHEWASFG